MGQKPKTYKKDYNPKGGAVENHADGVKRAKKARKGEPEANFRCKVFGGPKLFEILKKSIEAIEASKKKRNEFYSDRVITFGEIKTIK